MGWLRAYNDGGPEASSDRRRGGRAPFLRPKPSRPSSKSSGAPSRRPTASPAGAGRDGRAVVAIWAGAPWHRARIVRRTAAELGIAPVALPGYGPDRNPVEGLWTWMREEVTQHYCHDTRRELFDACKSFVDDISRDPLAVVRRLWPRFTLDPEAEKLGLSN